MESIEFIVTALGYFFMGGLTFRRTAAKSKHPDDPWETPGPLLAGVFWPVTIPFALGSATAGDPKRGEVKSEAKRAAELKEAEHRKALAKIEAETLAIQERSAGLGQ